MEVVLVTCKLILFSRKFILITQVLKVNGLSQSSLVS